MYARTTQKTTIVAWYKQYASKTTLILRLTRQLVAAHPENPVLKTAQLSTDFLPDAKQYENTAFTDILAEADINA